MPETSHLADTELIFIIQEGKHLDEAARFMYRAYYPVLAAYIHNNSGNDQDAEDMFQEVVVSFINLVQKGKFRGESSVKTFLYSMNRHLWLNELKRKGRALAREAHFEREQGPGTLEMEDSLVDRESSLRLMEVLTSLGEACRQILVLYYYENMSMKDILSHMNYENEQVARNKKYKCMKKLESLLNENPGLKESLKNLLHG